MKKQCCSQTPGISLALGGGGARALSNLGVLQVLEEQKIPIAAIAGTSMGAVIGSLYARHNSAAKVTTILHDIDWRPLRYLLDLRFPLMGLVSGGKVLGLFRALLEDANFSDLLIPFAAVATDIKTGETVEINQGDIASAVQASIAIPMLFSPVKHGGRLLVDGGLTEPTPAPTARNLGNKVGASCVVAVDITPSPTSRRRMSSRIPSQLVWDVSEQEKAATSKLIKNVSQWLQGQALRFAPSGTARNRFYRMWSTLMPGQTSDRLSVLEVAIQTTNILRHSVAQLALADADIVIKPGGDNIGALDFAHAGEAVAMGREAAMTAIPKILEHINS